MNNLAVLVLLSLTLGASATVHLRLKQSSKQSVAAPVCAENQHDHFDGGCPTHKKNGGCSVANPQHLAWRARCPESCGVCVPAAAFTCGDGLCAAWAVTSGPCSASNLADPSPAQCAAAVKLVGGWGPVTPGAWNHMPSGCSANNRVHPHYNAMPKPKAPNYKGAPVVCVRSHTAATEAAAVDAANAAAATASALVHHEEAVAAGVAHEAALKEEQDSRDAALNQVKAIKDEKDEAVAAAVAAATTGMVPESEKDEAEKALKKKEDAYDAAVKALKEEQDAHAAAVKALKEEKDEAVAAAGVAAGAAATTGVVSESKKVSKVAPTCQLKEKSGHVQCPPGGGTPGHCTGLNIIKPPHVYYIASSVQDCADECVATKGCTGFHGYFQNGYPLHTHGGIFTAETKGSYPCYMWKKGVTIGVDEPTQTADKFIRWTGDCTLRKQYISDSSNTVWNNNAEARKSATTCVSAVDTLDSSTQFLKVYDADFSQPRYQVAPITNCGPVGSEYMTKAPSMTSDRVCVSVRDPCVTEVADPHDRKPEGWDDRPRITSSNVDTGDMEEIDNPEYQGTWKPRMVANEYESQAPTATMNRVCTAQPQCTAGQVVSTAGTATSPRVCKTKCQPHQYYNTHTQACKDTTVCPTGEHETRAPTDTTDRSCGTIKRCVSKCPNLVNTYKAGTGGRDVKNPSPCNEHGTTNAFDFVVKAGDVVTSTDCQRVLSSLAGAINNPYFSRLDGEGLNAAARMAHAGIPVVIHKDHYANWKLRPMGNIARYYKGLKWPANGGSQADVHFELEQ